MMCGRITWSCATLVALLTAPACGLLSQQGGESAEQAAFSVDASSPVDRPERESSGAATFSSGDAGGSSTTELPSSTTTLPPPTILELEDPAAGQIIDESDLSTLSPQERLALDKCQRVGAFHSAGKLLYSAAAGNEAFDGKWLDVMLEGLRGLIPVVSPEGDVPLQALIAAFQDAIPGMIEQPDHASVSRLQALIDEVAPTVSQLLGDLREACPTSMSEDAVTKTERLDLSEREY